MANNTPPIIILVIILIVIAVVFSFFFAGDSGLFPPADGTQAQVFRTVDAELLAPHKDEDTNDYSSRVKAAAVASAALEIGANCVMTPTVLETRENTPIMVQNKDTSSRMILFEDHAGFSLAPMSGRSINITEAFGKGAGIHRYRCTNGNSSAEGRGIIYLTQ